jgi:hypothetical protein
MDLYHTIKSTSKGRDNIFCSRPWTLRLRPLLLVFENGFDDKAFSEGEAFSSLRRLAMNGVAVRAIRTNECTLRGTTSTFKVIIRFANHILLAIL